MTVGESVRIGVQGLIEHRIRSILTALGIIFGVAAVIAMLSIGEGARQEALEQIRLMGMNNILIKTREVKQPTLQRQAKASFSPGLTTLDGDAILAICPGVKNAIPQWQKSVPAQVGSDQEEVRLIGTTPEYLAVLGYSLESGRFFSAMNVREQANVCVLGSDSRASLFRFADPIGRSVKIDNQWFEVIGVMGRRTPPGRKVENLEMRNLNLDVYIPITTAQYKMERYISGGNGGVTFIGGGIIFGSSSDRRPVNRNILDEMTVKLADGTNLDEASKVISRILERRHFGIRDYDIVVPETLVEQSQKTQQIFNVVMGAIAGISLLVGGIGIMNIMLASVLERTREIGVRRAVGATFADILGQFLFEAAFLSVAGGLIGICVGFGMTALITLYAGWRTVVSPVSILLAFSVSGAVGVAFGYYPARKAALQHPIEALRYE